MSQSTEIKISTSTVTFEHITGSRQLANFFGLSLLDGEGQRRLTLTGQYHYKTILKGLVDYAKAYPNSKAQYMVTLVLEEKEFFDQVVKGHSSYLDDSDEFKLTVEILLTN